jgi:hypothetical protein
MPGGSTGAPCRIRDRLGDRHARGHPGAKSRIEPGDRREDRRPSGSRAAGLLKDLQRAGYRAFHSGTRSERAGVRAAHPRRAPGAHRSAGRRAVASRRVGRGVPQACPGATGPHDPILGTAGSPASPVHGRRRRLRGPEPEHAGRVGAHPGRTIARGPLRARRTRSARRHGAAPTWGPAWLSRTAARSTALTMFA